MQIPPFPQLREAQQAGIAVLLFQNREPYRECEQYGDIYQKNKICLA